MLQLQSFERPLRQVPAPELTLQEFQDRIQENVAEPILSTGWFTPTSIKNWVNAGTTAVWLKIMGINPNYFGVKSVLGSFVAGQQEYNLSATDPFEIRAIEITDLGDPYTLEEVPFEQKNAYFDEGEPEAFYWMVDYNGPSPVLSVGLLPTPSRSATNNMKLYIIPRPKVLTALSDSSDIPLEYQELIVLWASMAALRSDGSRPTAELQNEFNFRLANMMSLAARGRSGGPIYVNYREEY